MAFKRSKNNFYVYAHRKPNGEIFYIGKGSGNRAYRKTSRSDHWRNIVAIHGFHVDILCEKMSEDAAFELEELIISELGRKDIGTGVLCNKATGGVGGQAGREPWNKGTVGVMKKNKTSFRKGHKISEKEKIKASLAIKKRYIRSPRKLHRSFYPLIIFFVKNRIFQKDIAEFFGVSKVTIKKVVSEYKGSISGNELAEFENLVKKNKTRRTAWRK